MLSLRRVRDEDLLHELLQLVKQSRGVGAHIGEVERRRLYAREACSSMFEYCRRLLCIRENEAYLRITVARAARENPVLEMLRDGRLHLSGIASRPAPSCARSSSACRPSCAPRFPTAISTTTQSRTARPAPAQGVSTSFKVAPGSCVILTKPAWPSASGRVSVHGRMSTRRASSSSTASWKSRGA
jgi:hypothetical protein